MAESLFAATSRPWPGIREHVCCIRQHIKGRARRRKRVERAAYRFRPRASHAESRYVSTEMVESQTGKETCSFCGKPRRLAWRMLVARDRVIICDACVADLASTFANVVPLGSTATCALCGKGEQQRRWFRRVRVPLFAHRSGKFVCAECLLLAGRVLELGGMKL